MNIYENVATEAMVLLFKTAAVWKKRLVFNFLLEPFEQNDDPKKKIKFEDIADVESQETLKGSRPDFTITLNNGEKIHFEVKINDDGLTDSERKKGTRNAFLVKADYAHWDEIPLEEEYVLTWDDLFNLIDENEATSDFAMFDLLRQTIFGNTVNRDYEFLSRFLYNEEIIKKELEETFCNVLELMKKDDSIEIEKNPTDDKLEVSLKKKKGRSCIALEYQFGNEYHTGTFLFCGKEFSVEKDIGFEKPFDRVIYFCDKLYSFRKDYKEKFDTFLVSKTDFCERVLKKYAEKLSKKSYWNLCQDILSERLYPKLGKWAKAKHIRFDFDRIIRDSYEGYWPKIYFFKDSWNYEFYIAFQIDMQKLSPINNPPEFYYGIFIDGKDKPSCIRKLEGCIKNDYKTNKSNPCFPREKHFDKASPYKQLDSTAFIRINENPDELAGIMKDVVEELLEAITAVGL